jgi:hypothetical protein
LKKKTFLSLSRPKGTSTIFRDVQTYIFENYIKNATKIYKKKGTKKVVPKKVSCGINKLAFFRRVFDLVPPSIDTPWIFLVC